MSNHVRFFYLRNAPTLANKKGDPYACIIMRTDSEKNRVEYQYSVCNPKDTFRREVAHKACEARLAKSPRVLSYPNIKGASCHDITRAVMIDIAQDCDRVVSVDPEFVVEKGAPLRARKGAQAWLDSHSAITADPIAVSAAHAFDTALPAA